MTGRLGGREGPVGTVSSRATGRRGRRAGSQDEDVTELSLIQLGGREEGLSGRERAQRELERERLEREVVLARPLPRITTFKGPAMSLAPSLGDTECKEGGTRPKFHCKIQNSEGREVGTREIVSRIVVEIPAHKEEACFYAQKVAYFASALCSRGSIFCIRSSSFPQRGAASATLPHSARDDRRPRPSASVGWSWPSAKFHFGVEEWDRLQLRRLWHSLFCSDSTSEEDSIAVKCEER